AKYRLASKGDETTILGILRLDRRWRGLFAYDEMGHRILMLGSPPWHSYEPVHNAATIYGARGFDPDTDPVRLADSFKRAFDSTMSPQRLLAAVAVVARDQTVHPVRNWLKNLPAHDGIKRVEEFATKYLGAKDTPYTRAVGRVFLVSL